MRINIPNVQWEPLSGVLPPVAIRAFNGVNKLDRFSIEDTYATSARNLTSTGYPAMKVREGFTYLGSNLGARILGLDSWKDSELHAIANGNWWRWKSNGWTSLASGLDSSAHWSFCNFKGAFNDFNLIGANGVDPIKKYDGTSVSNLTGAPSGGKYIDTHDGRLYCAVDNMVHFSALNDAEDWSDTDPYVGSGVIRINDERGKNIIGLKAGTEHLLTFFPGSVYELYGTGPDDYRMIRIAEDIGLLSDQCVVTVGGVIYWADDNGIYRYTGGSRPRKDFSLPVQHYIDNMNKEYKHKCCAGTDGKRLYISLPYGSTQEPNVTLQYDPEFSGIWYVWDDMFPVSFAKAENTLYFGDGFGRVAQMGGTTDNGVPISWKWISRPFGSGIGAQNIRWYRMWVICEVGPGSSFDVYLSAKDQGDDDWVKVNTVTADTATQKRKVIIPVDTVANAGWIRVKFEGTGPASIYEFDRQERQLPI